LGKIEVCLEAGQVKQLHRGNWPPPARSTLARALDLRDCQRSALRPVSREPPITN